MAEVWLGARGERFFSFSSLAVGIFIIFSSGMSEMSCNQ
jgi:hypothetical protein